MARRVIQVTGLEVLGHNLPLSEASVVRSMAATMRSAQRASSGGVWHGLPEERKKCGPFISPMPSRPPEPQPGEPAGAAVDPSLAILGEILRNVREHVNAPPLCPGPRRP